MKCVSPRLELPPCRLLGHDWSSSERKVPMYSDLEQIQPGWEVYEPAGDHIGDVIGVEADRVHIQTNGLSTPELFIPQNAIAEIEPHRVELNVPKNDLNGRGWERRPE
jgi:hypothetical protein